jgi:Zn-finger nucleic acid-binding protein
VLKRNAYLDCPICKAPRDIAIDSCPNCGDEWPEPALDKTEIFDNTKPADAYLALENG